MKRQRNDGIRKRCDCSRRHWARCSHDWHFSYLWAGVHHRFSLDRHLALRVESKADARAHAERIRHAIRDGTFQQPTPATAAGPAVPEALTLAVYAAVFMRSCPLRSGKHKGQPRGDDDQSKLNRLVRLPGADGEPLGPRPIGSLTEADLEAALKALRSEERSASTHNKYLTLLRLMSKWGVRKGYLPRSWFTAASEESPELTRHRGAQRARRLEPAEERRLLACASPWLQRLILAALETACRQGELLALRWADVSLARQEFIVRDSKSGASRTLPISQRLRGVLEMVRFDAEGKAHAPTAFVFGDADGERVGSPLTGWESAVLKAHGHPATRNARTHGLISAARTAYRAANLHFHDLRHEAGSRMLEAGWPLHHVQMMLGHADLKQTSVYLNVARGGLQESMKRFGTQPLHPVAPPASGEHRPPSNTPPAAQRQVILNQPLQRWRAVARGCTPCGGGLSGGVATACRQHTSRVIQCETV